MAFLLTGVRGRHPGSVLSRALLVGAGTLGTVTVVSAQPAGAVTHRYHVDSNVYGYGCNPAYDSDVTLHVNDYYTRTSVTVGSTFTVSFAFWPPTPWTVPSPQAGGVTVDSFGAEIDGTGITPAQATVSGTGLPFTWTWGGDWTYPLQVNLGARRFTATQVGEATLRPTAFWGTFTAVEGTDAGQQVAFSCTIADGPVLSTIPVTPVTSTAAPGAVGGAGLAGLVALGGGAVYGVRRRSRFTRGAARPLPPGPG